MKKKLFIIRFTILALLILLSIFLYITGKEHKIFIDNKNISLNGVSYIAEKSFKIVIDGKDCGIIEKGERMVAKVTGTRHIVTIEELENKIFTGKKYEKNLKLNSNENVVINIFEIIEATD